MTFAYRPMTEADAPAWRDLRIEGARDFPLGFFLTETETRGASLDRTREVLAAGTMRCVTHDGALVGFCGYRPGQVARTQHRAELGPFFVRTSLQGTGAAKAMMDGVVAEARDGPVAILDLCVDAENHRAIAFYEREGFRHLATVSDLVRIDGKPRLEHHYRRTLT